MNRSSLIRRSASIVAVGCLLVVAAGIWVVKQNDIGITEEHVTVPGAAEPLNAVLAAPKHASGPHGLVIFVHGDGAANADRDSFYRPLWESFARAGYASLSWDKPGVQGAPGNWLDQSMHDRAVEVEAAVEWARARPDIDPRRVGVWGISQAGWVVPEVAARRPDLQFVILVGPAINWLRQGEYNLRADLRARQATESETSIAMRRRAESVRLLRAGASYAEYVAAGVDDAPMSAERWRFVSRNFRADASAELAHLRVPTLVMLGADDRNVDVAETARVYRQLIPAGLLTVQTFPNASHSIVTSPLEYEQGVRAVLLAVFAPRSLYADGYLESLRRFVERQNGGTGGAA